jgi:hypothetical protein
LVESNIGLAVGNQRPASITKGRELVAGGTFSTDRVSSGVIASSVAKTVLDIIDATSEVLSKVISIEADIAKILVAGISETVWDVDETKASAG